MDTIFLNSKNSKTSEPYVLILKLTDKVDLRSGEKSISLSNLSIYYTWKNIKSWYNNNEFKISASTWNGKLDHILYQLFKIILSVFLKKDGENINNPSVRIYLNKIENRVTFKIKTEYYLEVLTPGKLNYLEALKIK